MRESDELHALQREVARFQEWANTKFGDGPRGGEWEMEYNHWDDLYHAFEAFIAAVQPQDWDQTTTDLVLYAIARNNEMEDLVRSVAATRDHFVLLAGRAVDYPDYDARWQIAQVLSELDPHPPEVEPLLLQFARDDNEYVRRRALGALASVGSPAVEELAEAAWQTGDEYQRKAALWALDEIGSPRLKEFAARSINDDQPYLALDIAYIREHGTLR